MMHFVFSECKDKLYNKYTLIALFGMCFCMLMVTVGVKDNGDKISLLQALLKKESREHLFYLENLIINLRSICLEIAYPLLAGVVSSSVYCDRYLSKYDRYLILRSGRKKYAATQLISIVVIEFVISLLAVAFYYGCVWIISDELITITQVLTNYISRSLWLWILLCFGGSLSLICAVLTHNKYISLLVPVYLCYVFRMISEKMIAMIDWSKPVAIKEYVMGEIMDPKCLYYFDSLKELLEGDFFCFFYPFLLLIGISLILYKTILLCRKGY